MHKKKVLVHGTAESLKKFSADAASRDFEVIAVLSEDNVSVPLEVLKPRTLPQSYLRLVDGIIFTGERTDADYFLRQGLEPRKIILWDAQKGWEYFGGRDKDGTQVAFMYGLEFHIRNRDDEKFFRESVWRLQTQRQFKNLSPQAYPAILAQIFKNVTGKRLDLDKPQTYTEKLQWLKIYDATPLKSRLADKYLVRRWVAEKIGQEYLIPLLGVWDNFDDIDFNELPNQFVLKCNHGSGMNIIVRDKLTFDRRAAREKINAWLAFDYSAQPWLELHYTRIKHKILAEKYIEDMSGNVIDYKFHCFGGEPQFISVIGGRDLVNHTRFQEYYDFDWKNLGDWLFGDYNPFPQPLNKPARLKKMKRLAEILSAGFSYVRVDFYEIGGKILFGEMTFTPQAGFNPYKNTWTYERDSYLGSLLTLPNLSPPPM